MAALVGVKNIGGSSSNEGLFSNEERWIQAVYNFASDTGAQADLDVLVNGSSTINYVITDFFAYVDLAGTTATTSVIDLGISAGGVEVWSNKDAASLLTLGAVVGMDTAKPVLLPASGKVVMGIETGDLTAGKFTFNFKVKQIV